MTDIKVGDEVLVFDGWHARHDRRSVPGEVVKVGRALVSIKFGGRTEVFRIDTGLINLANGGSEFMTLEHAERDMRRTAAIAVLTSHHIEFKTGRERSFTLEQLEALAELVKTFDSEAGQ
jgi:hypothetical protein